MLFVNEMERIVWGFLFSTEWVEVREEEGRTKEVKRTKEQIVENLIFKQAQTSQSQRDQQPLQFLASPHAHVCKEKNKTVELPLIESAAGRSLYCSYGYVCVWSGLWSS